MYVFFTFGFEKESLTEFRQFGHDWLASKPKGPFNLHLPSTEITCVLYYMDAALN